MNKCIKTDYKALLLEFLKNNLPNGQDNLKQIFLKLFFLILIVGITVSGFYFGSYYKQEFKQEKRLTQQREIFENNDLATAQKVFESQNNDYTAWLKLGNTKLNNPVYQCYNNSYYLNYNSDGEQSRYGELFFDKRCKEEDQNIVIYGHSSKNGSMFGTLDNLRSLSFYKENPELNFTLIDKTVNYKIYAVFVLNADKKDDGNYIYNIYRNEFYSDLDFEVWVNEAKSRSVIDTKLDVQATDKIITLVTECNDFENARLVVMARSEREVESLTGDAEVNAKPKYPKKWYEVRNIDYPF